MSVEVSRRVWKQHRPETRGDDLVLLLKLADSADDDGFAWPGDELLTETTGLEERQLRRAKRRLEELGEIARVAGQGRGHVSVYHVLTGLSEAQRLAATEELLHRAESLAETLRRRRQKRGQIRPLSGEEKGTDTPPIPAEKGTNRVEKRGQIVSRKGDNAINVDPVPVRSDPLTHQEPIMTPPPPTPSTPNSDAAGAAGGGGSAAPPEPAPEPPSRPTQPEGARTKALLRDAGVSPACRAELSGVPPDVAERTIAACRKMPRGRDVPALVVSHLRAYLATGEELAPPAPARPPAPPPLPVAPPLSVAQRRDILNSKRRF